MIFRKAIGTAALALLCFGASAQKRQVMLDKVVAVVGGSSILSSEVDEYAGSSSSSAARRATPPTAIRATRRSRCS